MGKSETKKQLIAGIERRLGDSASEACYYDDTKKHNVERHNIWINRNIVENPRHNKKPLSASLIDGNVKLMKCLRAKHNLPDAKSVSEEKWTAIYSKTVTKSNWDDDEFDSDDADEADSTPVKSTPGRIQKVGMMNMFSRKQKASWGWMIKSFNVMLVEELIKLSPPPFYTNANPRRPSHSPVVVLGFDKWSEIIKAETQAKRVTSDAKSTADNSKFDRAHNYETKRGVPVEWDHLSSADFAFDELLPYPPGEAVKGDNRRKIIRKISCCLLSSLRDGSFMGALTRAMQKWMLPRVFTIVIDGHRTYLEDDKVISEFSPSDIYMTHKSYTRARGRGGPVPHGMDSELFCTPIVTHIVRDDECVLEKIGGFDRHKIPGHPAYWFVHEIPLRASVPLESHYSNYPYFVPVFASNDCGEFDFTMFQYLFDLCHGTEKRKCELDFVTSTSSMYLDRIRQPVFSHPMSFRILTSDTDALVLAAMAVETLGAHVDIPVSIFLAVPMRSNAGKDKFKLTSQKSPNRVYDVGTIVRFCRKIIPEIRYPTTTLLLLMYIKENDYMPMCLKNVGYRRLFDTVVWFHPREHLIIDKFCPADRRAWARNSNKDAEWSSTCSKLLDLNVLRTLLSNSVEYTNGKIQPPVGEKGQKKGATAGMPSFSELDIRCKQFQYFFLLYHDSVTGRCDERSVPETLASTFAFIAK
jgi:hypothetical protein